ncbi:hypothetical protein CAPNMURICA_45 [Arthrobacter phage CapnMurica]|uniref:Uncharacterized protein n=1 Tax=Arthrobacter phage CapnMurica TaxID=1772294 RepID=A0A0U4JA07_9CAUD|nr:hypothetical protein FDH68_gp45 [Arthrobacter phage CaptnMurica]ALY08645.1 hypothetical protein CAPNMURICA_45 [Arthrobacter phage CaptnMurica]
MGRKFNTVAYFFWKIRASVWVFYHAYHAANHKVNGSSIALNYPERYMRCRRCQSRFSIPSNVEVEGN